MVHGEPDLGTVHGEPRSAVVHGSPVCSLVGALVVVPHRKGS
jgi:hypothetical protein